MLWVGLIIFFLFFVNTGGDVDYGKRWDYYTREKTAGEELWSSIKWMIATIFIFTVHFNLDTSLWIEIPVLLAAMFCLLMSLSLFFIFREKRKS